MARIQLSNGLSIGEHSSLLWLSSSDTTKERNGWFHISYLRRNKILATDDDGQDQENFFRTRFMHSCCYSLFHYILPTCSRQDNTKIDVFIG